MVYRTDCCPMFRILIFFAVWCSPLFVAWPLLAKISPEPFASPASGVHRGLTRIAVEESGLTVASTYRDPRAWGERLQAASVGTVGTGIGVGDFNNDGWPDLFVGIREGPNRLYINRGGSRFSDQTEEAGILQSSEWTTGVTVVDINGDSLPDIYVCFFDAPNRLYLNRGDAIFEEVAAELGLAVSDASSGAFFADYDKDGDLDLYLQTNIRYEGGGQPDFLFRNDGKNGFVDVTDQVGIRHGEEGKTLGHSVLWIDYDGDGWEDLYVANDFQAPDFLYMNKGDGTFHSAPEMIPVAPYSSMGSDVGDVTGNGLLDILTTDMATPSYAKHVESMLTSAVKTRELPPDSLPRQVMKNALLLNRGGGDYVDVAYAWNLAATDWTWAPRLVDLDNDGWQDALFTNGMIRQFHNADLALEQDRQTSVAAKTAVFKRSPVLSERNLVFRNAEGHGFDAVNQPWGFEHEGVSFGTAVFDYDRDGDLDLVYTNYEAPPTLWRNDLGKGNAVQVRLEGSGGNTQAIGAVAVAHIGEDKQARKILANRGYLGSDEKLLHFGLGEAGGIDLLEIQWPNGDRQTERDLQVGYRYVVLQADTVAKGESESRNERITRFVWKGDERDAIPLSPTRPSSGGEGLLYPLKPIPTSPKPKLVREDFNLDGQGDTLILRDWAAPRLILSGSHGMAEVSEEWGVSRLSGLWEVALTGDFNGDAHPDVFLGGIGINNEVSYRSKSEGTWIRHLGRFSSNGPKVNMTAYEWGGKLRLYDGLRDYSEIEGRILSRIASFRDTAELTSQAFIDRVGFQIEETVQVDHFKSGLLLNQEGGGFRFEPLPLEAQYGRVWDVAAGDLNRDGTRDLVLLLGQVSPHYRSSQGEGSSICVLLGESNGVFKADPLTPLDRLPIGRVIGLKIEGRDGEVALNLQMEDGRRIIYRAVKVRDG